MIFPILISFACGAITAAAAMVMLSMGSKSSDYTLDLLNDVLSEENDSLVAKCEQLSQSLIETSQDLRRSDDRLAYYESPQTMKEQL